MLTLLLKVLEQVWAVAKGNARLSQDIDFLALHVGFEQHS